MIATGALLASVQILIVNIIMDSLNSLSFGGEPPKDEYMTEKPIKKGSGLFIRGAKKRIAISTVAFIALYGEEWRFYRGVRHEQYKSSWRI